MKGWLPKDEHNLVAYRHYIDERLTINMDVGQINDIIKEANICIKYTTTKYGLKHKNQITSYTIRHLRQKLRSGESCKKKENAGKIVMLSSFRCDWLQRMLE